MRATFMTAVEDEFEGEREAGRATLVTEDELVLEGKWTEITVKYDRAFFTIDIAGLEVARVEQDGFVRSVAAPLLIGGSGSPFPGAIDDLVMSAVTAGEAFELPVTVEFGAKAPETIRFQAGGGLDRLAHREPVQILLIFEDGREDSVRVSLYGAVE